MDSRSARVNRVRPVEDAAARLPILAIVGRPNVGKSTLFNRLARARRAIVDDQPGVTRDRNYTEAEWEGRKFLLIDTGGFETDAKAGLKKQIQEQSFLAMKEADVILFLFDAKAGLNPLDREAVNLLRGIDKPVFFAVNKIDVGSKEPLLYEFYDLGLSDLFPLSAEHGGGLANLMERIVEAFPQSQEIAVVEEGQKILRLAIIGRPNVGKSTLVNRLLGYDRSVVDSAPGTTRDPLQAALDWEGTSYVLVDTAGLRRKSRISDSVERYSVTHALRSVDQADIVIQVLDPVEEVTDQDAQILAYASRRAKGILLAVNKWDLVPPDRKDPGGFARRIFEKLAFLDFAPLAVISAQTGYGIQKMMMQVRQLSVSYQSVIQTSTLNRALQTVTRMHTPPAFQGRQVKFYYATQTDTSPPAFTLFVNRPSGIRPAYKRYLTHQLRTALGLDNVPLRLFFRPRREEKRGRTR